MIFPDGVDLTKLMLEIKRSPQYLMSHNAQIDLKWCLHNADKIISGKYQKYADESPPKPSTFRNYSKEELEEINKSLVYTADTIDQTEI